LHENQEKKELSSQKVFFELAFIPKKFRNQVKEALICHSILYGSFRRSNTLTEALL